MKKVTLVLLAFLILFSSVFPVYATSTAQSVENDINLSDEALDITPSEKELAGFNIVSNEQLQIRYDDIKNLQDIFKGYSIVKVVEQSVSSNKVVNGQITDNLDDNVITVTSEDVFRATAVGSASLLLVKKEDIGFIQEFSDDTVVEKVDAIMLNVTVTKAPLTVVYITGQSNAEGYNSKSAPFTPNDSIVCEKGQVYSSYAPHSSMGIKITGLSNLVTSTVATAPDYVAGALGNDYEYSVSNKKLVYTLDSLTAQKNGKTGFDAAFAYEWNNLTDDKVWVVNAAAGGTTIGKWQKGETVYERAMAVFKAAEQTLNAEIAAGHYELNKKLCLWLQGESNVSTVYSTYDTYFKRTVNLINSNLELDCFGIIITRAALSKQHKTQKDLSLTAPRIVQPLVSYSKDFPNVYMLSVANEFWATDSSVKNYFTQRYPDGYLTYPLRENTNLHNIPTTVNELHFDIHYTQAAHNETGLDTARNFFSLCNDLDETVSFSFIDADGNYVKDRFTSDQLSPFKLSLRVYPPYKGKKYTTSIDKNYLVFDDQNGVYVPKNRGLTKIKVLDENLNEVYSIEVNIPYKLSTPKIKSITNLSTGAKITWNKVDGAYKYRVFYYTGGKYKRLATTSSTSFTHEGLKSSTEYRYTVRCVAKNGEYDSDYNKDGWYNKFLSVPKITKIQNNTNSVKITWNKVPGAEKYRVFVKKAGASSWKIEGDTIGTSYTDKTVSSSTKYIYTVRCVSQDSSEYQSAYDKAGKSITFIKAPKISKATVSSKGINLQWSKVKGAKYYRIFVKTQSGWKALKTTSSTSYLDKNVKKGKEYIYTVRCLSNDKTKYISAYYSDGYKVEY